jgi:hypothetical protein
MKRLLLHLPVGVACALLLEVSGVLSAILAVLFLFYETNEDRHLKDQAYKDIAGAAWGVALGGLILYLARRVL